MSTSPARNVTVVLTATATLGSAAVGGLCYAFSTFVSRATAGLSTVDAANQWRAYIGPWTAWNHVRTVAPLLGSVLLLVGLRHR